MGARTQPSERNSIEDDSEQQIGSISLMISNLRNAFLKEDFDRVEEALIARETKLTREIKKLEEQRNVANTRYEDLLEEVKKGMNDDDDDDDDDDKDRIFELRRKNEELEEENGKLKVLLERKYKKLEGNIVRLTEDTTKLADMERSDSGASISNHSGDRPVEIGARGSPLRALSQCNGDDHTSGLQKSSPRNTIVIIDSDNDSACGVSVQNKPSEKPKDSGSLILTSVEKKPMGLKRKRSLSSSDNENNGDNFGQEFSPTSEMKLHLMSSLEPSCFPVNQCSDTMVASDINNPRSSNALISRQDVEKNEGEQNPQSFLRSLSEMRKDWDSSDSSTSTSSSSDDDGLAEIVYKRLQEAKESKAGGNHQPCADSRE